MGRSYYFAKDVTMSLTKVKSVHVQSAAVYGLVLKPVKSREPMPDYAFQQEMVHISFSASGLAKFFIYKNGEVLATLFNSKYNLNVEYQHPVRFYEKDRIEFGFLNRDSCVQDLYASYEEQLVPST